MATLTIIEKHVVAFPRFPMDLRFGDTSKQAIPVITVMDVLSFMRTIVMEDKKSNAMLYLNSEPQLIADLIAMPQRNSRETNVLKKRGRGEPEKEMVEENYLNNCIMIYLTEK